MAKSDPSSNIVAVNHVNILDVSSYPLAMLLAATLTAGTLASCSSPESKTEAALDDALSEDDRGSADDRNSDSDDDAAADAGCGECEDAGNGSNEDALARVTPWIGDGTSDGVELVTLYTAPQNFFCTASGCREGLAVDLDFNPFRQGELWVLYRQPYSGEPCEESNPQSLGCQLMPSRVVVLSAADGENPQAEVKDDGNAWHFMRLGTSLAFADDDSFATVSEARTGNWMDHPADFMGPTWWSSDPEIFGVDFGLNGSHLDMLHGTPRGMGIAHDPTEWDVVGEIETQPVFWAFNGEAGALDRYDFKEPHEPGGEDHSDGTLHRYVEGQLKMVPGVPSHMAFADLGLGAPAEGLYGRVRTFENGGSRSGKRWALYVADSGNQRIVRLDTTQGTLGALFATADPQLAEPRMVEDATLEEVVPRGTLTLPSGIAVAGDLFFVSDAQTSVIHAFDLEGQELGRLDTGLSPGALAGLAVGPDSRLYLVDWNQGKVLRIEPREGAE